MPYPALTLLCEREPTVLVWAVSAMCFVSIMKGFEYKVPSSVEKVIFSGEVMPVKQLNTWREFLPEATFVNVYGPTEITVSCNAAILNDAKYISVGRPLLNYKEYIVNIIDRSILTIFFY